MSLFFFRCIWISCPIRIKNLEWFILKVLWSWLKESTITQKFIYSEKATTFRKIFTLLLSYVVTVKSKVEIWQNFVAFSEYLNFTNQISKLMSIIWKTFLVFLYMIDKSWGLDQYSLWGNRITITVQIIGPIENLWSSRKKSQVSNVKSVLFLLSKLSTNHGLACVGRQKLSSILKISFSDTTWDSIRMSDSMYVT